MPWAALLLGAVVGFTAGLWVAYWDASRWTRSENRNRSLTALLALIIAVGVVAA